MASIRSAEPFVLGLVTAGSLSTAGHLAVVKTGSGSQDKQARRFTTHALAPAMGATLATGYLGSVLSPITNAGTRLWMTGASMGAATGMGLGMVFFGKEMGWL
jgi:hypothetical protein